MKLSNEKLIRDLPVLSEIAQKQLPVRVSYAIAKNIGKIEQELITYNKEREKLINKYAQLDEAGRPEADENGQIKLKSECIESWNNSIKELLNIESELDMHKFKLEHLDGISMKPMELMLIEYMIEE